ncbi:MAG TPA: FAD-dependent oxidoreductase [Candidatus Scatomorpha stercoravium]|nr:FAD-dependent oxidoreductase [Candidatus Scatomorpha stercoravium]
MKLNPGTYEGCARGYGGRLYVSAEVSEGSILSVKITKHREYRGIAWGLNTTPIESFPGLIVKYQSLNIPPVTGADVTCEAILGAVSAALAAAGASEEDIAALRSAPGPVPPEYEDEVRHVDVVVCGAGAGGLAAAIEVKEAGGDVVIVEKQGVTGGATARSGGKLLGAGTEWQKRQGIYDSENMVYDYLMEVGDRQGKFMDAGKTRYLVDNLNSTIEWLSSIEATVKGDEEEILAMPYQELSRPRRKDGALKTSYHVLDVEAIHKSLQPWRVHNSPGGGGQTNGQGGEISTPLTLYYENDIGGEIIYNTAMQELLTDEYGAVTGVVCRRANGAKLTLYARRGVIIATGGYARNKEMCSRYPVAHYFSNVPCGNVGEGLTAAERIGALNYEHPAVQVVYTSLSCGVGINDESGLIVNSRGERVVNEWTYQYTVSDAIARSGSSCGWYITSGDEPYPTVRYGFAQAVEGKSRDYAADSIEELAVKIKADPAVLKATYERYCELVEKGADEDFGKPAKFLHPIKGPKFAALRLHPCVTVTFGGLDTDLSARVIRPDGSVIPRLYAAGEVAGTGMYGTQYPTCGTSIGSALFYGRIAGRAVMDKKML